MKQTMWVVICAAAAMFLIAGCGGGSTSTTAEAQGEAANTQGEAANGDTPTATTIPDGHWERDVDFKPGTYRAPGGQECEWAQADKLEGVEVGSGHTHYGRNLLVEVRTNTSGLKAAESGRSRAPKARDRRQKPNPKAKAMLVSRLRFLMATGRAGQISNPVYTARPVARNANGRRPTAPTGSNPGAATPTTA